MANRRSPKLKKVAAMVFGAPGAHSKGKGGKWVLCRLQVQLGRRRKGEEQA
jgi:hypothetical protein